MIEINLLPEEFKTRIRRTERDSKIKQVIYLIPLLVVVLALAHIYFTIMLVSKNIQLGKLTKEFSNLEPQRKIIEQHKQELVSQDAGLSQQLTKHRIVWSQKLNKLSLDLPSGIWFKEIDITDKGVLIKGVAISLQKEEMALINKFIDNLKNDPGFFADFSKIELNSVQRKIVGGYDTVNFNLDLALKQK